MSIFSENCLHGRTYVVTGGSSGIGSATAALIAGCGGKVILAGRDEIRLHAVLSSLASGQAHQLSQQSLSNADEAAEWMKSLAELHGPFDGVFHAAGTELIRPARLIKQANLDEIFGSSLYAAFGIARAVSQKNVLVDGGSIVFMSSVAGATGQIGMTAYSASKAGIDGMVRSLACELASRRIRVNSIAAAAVLTPMHSRLTAGSGENATSEYQKSHLLGFGLPEDVANMAVFLLSAAGRWITGSSVAVDGGYMVR